jgi:hypothetical protein
MNRRFVVLHLAVIALATLGLWWFVFPKAPDKAVADGAAAAAVAGYVEVLLTSLSA